MLGCAKMRITNTCKQKTKTNSNIFLKTDIDLLINMIYNNNALHTFYAEIAVLNLNT